MILLDYKIKICLTLPRCVREIHMQQRRWIFTRISMRFHRHAYHCKAASPLGKTLQCAIWPLPIHMCSGEYCQLHNVHELLISCQREPLWVRFDNDNIWCKPSIFCWMRCMTYLRNSHFYLLSTSTYMYPITLTLISGSNSRFEYFRLKKCCKTLI